MLDDAAEVIAVEGPVVEWRGPSPFYFVAVGAAEVGALRAAAQQASYGWGCVPVVATIGTTVFRTSLFPKDGGYYLPLKIAIRRTLEVAPGDRARAVVRVVRPQRAMLE